MAEPAILLMSPPSVVLHGKSSIRDCQFLAATGSLSSGSSRDLPSRSRDAAAPVCFRSAARVFPTLVTEPFGVQRSSPRPATANLGTAIDGLVPDMFVAAGRKLCLSLLAVRLGGRERVKGRNAIA